LYCDGDGDEVEADPETNPRVSGIKGEGEGEGETRDNEEKGSTLDSVVTNAYYQHIPKILPKIGDCGEFVDENELINPKFDKPVVKR